MEVFIRDNIIFNEAITSVASSIIKEQEALTNLLNQEALKIKKLIEIGASENELLQVNNSITSMIATANTFN